MSGILRDFLVLLMIGGSVRGVGAAQAEATACQPLGYDTTELFALREADFSIEDAATRERFLFDVVDCLGDPDPVLRDQIGYEGLTRLLRSGEMAPETVERLRRTLIRELGAPEDALGVRRPFLILALAEVARVDRVKPVYTDAARQELVEAATNFMRDVHDYRGFDERVGWRHGVAHDADLLMQLSLNPAMTRDQLIQIRDAVGSQVVPGAAHFYIYGESGRLARPVLFAAMRGLITDEEWKDWFAEFASPAPFAAWGEVFSSQEGLAKLHNTKAFAQAIYVSASASADEALTSLATAALEVLRRLP